MRIRFETKLGKPVVSRIFHLLIGAVFFWGSSICPTDQASARPQIKPDKLTAGTQSDIQSNTSTPDPNGDPIIGLTYSDPVTVKWKVGVKILAGPSDARNIYIAIPVPNEWPEQTVAIDSENMPASVGNVTYANLNGGLRRQLIKIPVIRANEQLELTTIFKVSTSQINSPPKVSIFLKPDPKTADVENYLEKTRYISFHNSKIRAQISTLVAGKDEAWKEVEAIYDWVRDNIDQKEMPNSDTLKTFRKKVGSEEDKIALFVAMCRSHKIPARMIWVDGGCYAEFMLVDAQNRAHWFPCNVTGIREFGSISEPRIVLQKGENIKIPEKKERQKYVAEHLSCQGTSRPVITFVRELLPDGE